LPWRSVHQCSDHLHVHSDVNDSKDGTNDHQEAYHLSDCLMRSKALREVGGTLRDLLRVEQRRSDACEWNGNEFQSQEFHTSRAEIIPPSTTTA
jgi:hypothetical protein